MTKRALRRQVIAQIRALQPADRAAQEAALFDRLSTLPSFSTAHTILLYASHFPEEIATGPLIDLVVSQGRKVVLPRIDLATRRLVLHRGSQTAPGVLGIPEPLATSPILAPSEIDWVLVPGIAFDQFGNRLGRGGGYYDKLLPEFRPDCPRWAWILEPQWVEAVPVEPHDIRVDGVVSRSRSVEVGRVSSIAVTGL